MAKRIILLSGPVASGKSTLSSQLIDRFGMTAVSTRHLLEQRLQRQRRSGPARRNLQTAGDNLDRRTGGRWVLEGLVRELQDHSKDATVLVDCVRIPKQIEAIRDAYGPSVTHIHLTAPIEVLKYRYEQRASKTEGANPLPYEEVRQNKTERNVNNLKHTADVVIDTNRCTDEDVLIRAAAHLKLFGEGDRGYVDVLIGGQYGSEGKGQIASVLAKEYDLLVRVGGPIAGHKVFELPEPYTHHQLPSGTRKSDAKLLIGAGAVLNVDELLREIADCGVGAERLKIDRNAIIIVPDDIEREELLRQRIGSTKQGVGSATSRRIMDRGDDELMLARDVPDLRPYMCEAIEILYDISSTNGRVMLEGTQGTGLSLYHGSYPFVTSRDTTISGCLAEAGIAPTHVRKIIMVCRTYPIRVEGNSGPMSKDIGFAEISERSTIELETLERNERTSTTDRMRRVGEFDWTLLRKASLLNSPTDIALTFTDYLSPQNAKAKRFEQLHPDTINLIREVEQISGARVSLIATGFNSRSIIDMRNW